MPLSMLVIIINNQPASSLSYASHLFTPFLLKHPKLSWMRGHSFYLLWMYKSLAFLSEKYPVIAFPFAPFYGFEFFKIPPFAFVKS